MGWRRYILFAWLLLKVLEIDHEIGLCDTSLQSELFLPAAASFIVASLTQLRVYDCAPSFHVRDEGRPVHPPSPFPIAIFLHVTSVYGMIRAARKVTAALVYVKIVAAKEKRIIRNMTS